MQVSASAPAAARDTPVVEIARLLVEKRVSAVPVVEGGRPVGMVSEGGLLRLAEPGPARP